jgi:hypothetical protein
VVQSVVGCNGVPRNFFYGGGEVSTNLVENRGQKERGFGDGSRLENAGLEFRQGRDLYRMSRSAFRTSRPASYSMGTGSCSLRVKQPGREADQPSPSRDEAEIDSAITISVCPGGLRMNKSTCKFILR